jgi:hypothetical protein
VLLVVRARRQTGSGSPSRLAFAAAIAVFPVAFLDFAFFLLKGSFACGVGF